MTIGFFPKLALSNITKNRRFFVPRILSEAGLLACFYIMMTLAGDKRLHDSFGGFYLSAMMLMGLGVHTLLTVILMFYTNSFLMKQRKREFGLYNVLGMEKKHVGRVLFFESIFSSMCAIVAGLFFGMLFYKFFSLLICRLLHAEIIAGFYYLKMMTLLRPTAAFLAIDLVTYLLNRISIARMKPVELLQSQSAGEKEPKVKMLLLVIGLITLGAGYYIAITTQNPLQAMIMFFVAVVLVMIGTYCLFVTGSIFVLKCLKKKQNFYYNRNHMPAVSGLLYRMKQNSVGLASIAILATGVLVMISTTVSLYAGMEQTLADKYPQHYIMSQKYYDVIDDGDEFVGKVPSEVLKEIAEEAAGEQGLEIASVQVDHYLEVAYRFKNGEMSADRTRGTVGEGMENVVMATFLTAEQYEAFSGEHLDLKPDELAYAGINMKDSTSMKTLRLADQDFTVKQEMDWFPVASGMSGSVPSYGIVVADQSVLDRIYESQKAYYGKNASDYTDRIAVTFADLDQALEKGEAFGDAVWDGFAAYAEKEGHPNASWSTDAIWEARENLYGMYGTFLFLGILLGLVFIFATAMIIYYKQISEGYEDRQRFQIMKKIGMSEAEVRKTINKQILLVFYLPLIVAGVHLSFAFPMLEKLLHVLLMSNTGLFVICTLIVFALFAVIYVMIYKATARTYYKIVK